MEALGRVLSYILPVLYLTVIYLYYIIFSGKNKRLAGKTTIILFFLLAIHGAEIIIRNIALNTMPLSTAHDAYSFLAISILFVYMIIEMGLSERGSGLFILSFAFILEVISLSYLSWVPETNELLANPNFAIHASIAIMGYTALSLAAIYALMFLIQKRNLKNRKIGKLFTQLPALNFLERLNVRAIIVGIILLGIGIIFGHRQAYKTIGSYWPNDIKVILSDAIWLIYLLGFLLSRKLNWRGEKVAYYSLTLFIALIVGAAVVIFLSDSFHQFY
jgi:ABC-type uncharacterized transport system permease subunit